MNKKNLSVVMAGAMLATSVAPVLADTTEVKKYEISVDQQGVLRYGLRNFMDTKKFVATDSNHNLAGKSIYGITTNNVAPGENVAGGNDNAITGSLKAGDKVYVWDLGHREVNGKYYSTSDGTGTSTTEKYTLATLEADFAVLMGGLGNAVQSNYTEIIKNAELDKKAGVMTVTFLSVDDNFKNITKEYKIGEDRADLTKVISKDGVEYLSSAVKNNPSGGQLATSQVAGFATKLEAAIGVGRDIPAKKIAEITLTGKSENSLLVSDLYDGVMLTDKGYSLLDELKEATNVKFYAESDPVNAMDSVTGGSYAINTMVVPNKDTGVITFTIKYTNQFGDKKEYVVRGTDKKSAQTVAAWLFTKDPNVDILAGENRYETAVDISKEIYGKGFKLSKGGVKDVVIVNGTALVDGLAAAPYARTLQGGAPILLSESEGLPKATKDYLKELTKDIAPSAMKDLNIHLVGGTSVLSNSLRDELKDMGFTVKRISGDNRESTSLAVANEIRKSTKGSTDRAFVVGATGEADAMSIASVASDKNVNGTTDKVIPIIVSNIHGLSEDAVDYLSTSDITVVGGTSQISNEMYKTLNEKNGSKSIERIAGVNRQATNAAILKKYYSNLPAGKNIVVAKDGMKNKSELVDALAASNLASKGISPIVLATDKLSNDQINEIELMTTNAVKNVYQIGHGVSRDIMKTIVSKAKL